MEYYILYLDSIIGSVYHAPIIGDKYKGLTIYEVDYDRHYARVR